MKPATVMTMFILIFGFATIAFGETAKFPIEKMSGAFVYKENFQLVQIRRAETVDVESADGIRRVEELRAQGYTCIRKNIRTRLCSKSWKPKDVPVGLDEAVRRFMSGIEVEFTVSENQPLLVHDGSTTQEWNVHDPVRIVDKRVSLYRVVRNFDGRIFIVFPVTENQAVGVLNHYSNSKLGLTTIGTVKDSPTSTVGYSMEAYLETP